MTPRRAIEDQERGSGRCSGRVEWGGQASRGAAPSNLGAVDVSGTTGGVSAEGPDPDKRWTYATVPQRGRAASQTGGSRSRSRPGEKLLVAGAVAVLVAVLVLLCVLGRLWVESSQVASAQGGLERQLEQLWGQPGLDPASVPVEGRLGPLAGDDDNTAAGAGTPVLRLSIPKMGASWTVVAGVTPASLKQGPGLYPAMAPVGRPGNTAIAGHRIPRVFWNLDDLSPGDEVIVDTRGERLTYRIDSTRVVLPTQLEVLASHPLPGETSAESVLTLTTCTPKGANARRLVVFSRLVTSQPRG